jgi:hypothetical protein
MILRSFYNGALLIASKHDFDDQFFFFARDSTNKVPIFFIHRLGRRKKWGLSFERISDDVIAQKPMTLFKD